MNNWSVLEILSDVEKLFKIGNPGIELNIDVKDARIYVDYDRMKEVIWNILVNSAEAMGGTGKINISSTVSDNRIRLIFDDNGPGFEEKNLDKIFDPFFSTKKRGTGLGLAQVYRVINKFKGSVKALNTENGARIKVSLEINEES
jgi:two-component system sensor histidine kinase HydH